MMLRKMLLTGLVAISLPTTMWAAPTDVSQTEGAVCDHCEVVQTSQGPRLKNNLAVVASNLEIINQNFKFAGECSKFADDGSLGVYAKNIRTFFMNEDLPGLEEGAPDINQYCPNYQIMKPTDKANFWVLVLNAMAHFENSCKTSSNSHGPNGKLVGILQLHAQKEGAYVPSGAECRNGDGKTAEGSFRCAMIMLDSQLRNKKALFARGSYWDVLRPQAASRRVPVIISAIKKYGPCQDQSKLNVRQFGSPDAEIINALQHMQDPSDLGSWKVKDLTIPLDFNSPYEM